MLRFSSLILVAALLFGQAALLEHEYDFAAHKSGDTGRICLHATPLSHAVAGTIVLTVPRVTVRIEFYAPASRAVAVAGVPYRARAPPHPAFA